MEMNHKRPIKYSAITLGIVLATAFVLVQPTMQATYAQVGAEGAPNYFDCSIYYDDQLLDPVEMNSVRVQDIAKTIIAEKEIFRCQTEQGNIDVLVDVTVVAEILENMTDKTIISKQAHVIYCVKLAPDNQPAAGGLGGGDATLLGCDTDVPDTDFVPVTSCDTFNNNFEMQEMNTVNKGKTVKTIIVQKELLFCDFGNGNPQNPDGDDKKIEQYTIEEIWENLNLAPADTVVQQSVESLRCTTLVTEAFVESCQFNTVPVQEYNDED